MCCIVSLEVNNEMTKPKAPVPQPDIMTVAEVAEYLRLSKKTVYVLAREEKIPCKIIGSTFRFSRKTIENFV